MAVSIEPSSRVPQFPGALSTPHPRPASETPTSPDTRPPPFPHAHVSHTRRACAAPHLDRVRVHGRVRRTHHLGSVPQTRLRLRRILVRRRRQEHVVGEGVDAVRIVQRVHRRNQRSPPCGRGPTWRRCRGSGGTLLLPLQPPPSPQSGPLSALSATGTPNTAGVKQHLPVLGARDPRDGH